MMSRWASGTQSSRGALLELDGVAAGGRGNLDQALCDVDVTVVVDADLADHEAGVPWTDRHVPYGARVHEPFIHYSGQPSFPTRRESDGPRLGREMRRTPRNE